MHVSVKLRSREELLAFALTGLEVHSGRVPGPTFSGSAPASPMRRALRRRTLRPAGTAAARYPADSLPTRSRRRMQCGCGAQNGTQGSGGPRHARRCGARRHQSAPLNCGRCSRGHPGHLHQRAWNTGSRDSGCDAFHRRAPVPPWPCSDRSGTASLHAFWMDW